MQEKITYFEDTRYDNLTSLVESGNPKAAKLSSSLNFRKNVNAIKKQLRETKVDNKDETPNSPEVAVTQSSVVSQPPEVEMREEKREPNIVEENVVKFPTKESLEARTLNNTFYKELATAKNEAEVSYRKLRVAPQVVDSLNYTTSVLGIEPIVSTPQVSEEVKEEVPDTKVETPVEEPKAFDFGALPGVGENVVPSSESTEDPAYGDYIHTEQDNRLNDYLNRESSNANFSSSNLSELEEIRILKKKIEEARDTLRQVKGNVGDLQQRDAEISEQLAMYKKSLMEQIDAVNEEIGAETREWNNLTQLVREKEALIGENESYGKK